MNPVVVNFNSAVVRTVLHGLESGELMTWNPCGDLAEHGTVEFDMSRHLAQIVWKDGSCDILTPSNLVDMLKKLRDRDTDGDFLLVLVNVHLKPKPEA